MLNVIAAETAAAGGVAPKVIVSLGGQTPLKLASVIPSELIAGTAPSSIDLAEDREKWNALCDELRIPQPPGGTATDLEEALAIVEEVGFPVLVRPSYVLGGRAMQIVHDVNQLGSAMAELAGFGSLGREGGLSAERPVLVDRFLADAVEVDVDAVRDHTGEVLIGGVMEHVEEAGVHSGDSACAIPPPTLPSWVVEVIEAYTAAIAERLDVRGLINVQYAVTGTTVYVIEANPRASRTVPFVAKATGVPLAKVATRVMLGATLASLREEGLLLPSVLLGSTDVVAVKEAVLPFSRFPEVDPALGPEMRSTGEVMGIDRTFALAFYKAELAAGTVLPTDGTVFLSLADTDKPAGLVVAKRLRELGLGVAATQGTADHLARFGYPVDEVVAKVSEGEGKTAVDLIGAGSVTFVVNTPEGKGGRSDGEQIRKACTLHRVACVTTVDAALAAVHGLLERRHQALEVRSLQEHHGRDESGRDRLGRDASRIAEEVAPGTRSGPIATVSEIGRDVHRARRCSGPAHHLLQEPLRQPRRSSGRARRHAAVTVHIGSVELKNPVMTASGTAGYGTELAAYLDLSAPRCGRRQVARRLRVGGEPGAAPAPDGAGDAQRRRAAGTGHPVLAGPRPARPAAHRRHRGRLDLGAVRRRLRPRPPTCSPRRRTRSSPSRSTCRARTWRAVTPSSPTTPTCRPRSIAATAGCARPRWAKLSANTDRIVEVAGAVAGAGAEAVTCINTLLGLAYDPATRRPVLGAGGGGLSGPAIHPVAVRAVHDVHAAHPDLPIVGVGGVVDGWGATELLLAGACAVQVGTATFADPRAPARVLAELDDCDRLG